MASDLNLKELRGLEERLISRTVEIDSLKYKLQYINAQAARVQREKEEVSTALSDIESRLRSVDKQRALLIDGPVTKLDTAEASTHQAESRALLAAISEADTKAMAARKEQAEVQHQLWDLIDATHQLRSQDPAPDIPNRAAQMREAALLDRVRQLSAAIANATRIREALEADTARARGETEAAAAATERLRREAVTASERIVDARDAAAAVEAEAERAEARRRLAEEERGQLLDQAALQRVAIEQVRAGRPSRTPHARAHPRIPLSGCARLASCSGRRTHGAVTTGHGRGR
jgi:chromosome segregation ATPase